MVLQIGQRRQSLRVCNEVALIQCCGATVLQNLCGLALKYRMTVCVLCFNIFLNVPLAKADGDPRANETADGDPRASDQTDRDPRDTGECF